MTEQHQPTMPTERLVRRGMWRRASCKWRGHTLVELIAATLLTGAALVPALKLMRDATEISRETESRNILAILCDSELEEQLSLAAATWTPATLSGTFAAEGYPGIRYVDNVSDSVSDGGIPDRLMAVMVTVWDDANSNGSLDASEISVVMRSKTAKLSLYEAEGQN